MPDRVYPRYYNPAVHENLLMNVANSTAGFMTDAPAWRTGYYQQEIRLNKEVKYFVYRTMKLHMPFPYTRKAMIANLNNEIRQMQDDLGVNGLELVNLQSLYNLSATWVGRGFEKIGDYSFIRTPDGADFVYLRNAGRPTLIPEIIIYLRPLGFRQIR